jgi:mannose-6-phosphate isomerase-like protein (cupin superfamily)
VVTSDGFDEGREVDSKTGGDGMIENPLSGERLTFLARGRETDGAFTRVRFLLPPHGNGTPAHFHTILSERFEVVSGWLNVIVGEAPGSESPLVLGPGESASVPPYTVHRFWNATDEDTVFEAEVRPAGGFEFFMRASFGLARDGKTTKDGVPRNPFELGLLMRPADVYLPGLPVALQRAIFGVLASTARRLGYGPGFDRYADPSASPSGEESVKERRHHKGVHDKALEQIDGRVRELTTVVGWVSLGMGLPLTLAPRRSAALLGLLGRDERVGLARAVGVADLVIGPALLFSRYRARWMLARAILNAVIALIYARALKTRTPRRKRAVSGAVGMSVLALTDYFLARRASKAG